jgi:hypothetical protein
MADGQIELLLTLETGEVVKAFTKVETQAQTTANKVESGWSQAFKTGAAVKAVDVLSNAFFKLGSVALSSFKSAISEGLNAEASLNKFNASLRAAGLFSQGTSQSFQQFASAMQDATKFTDDEVLALSSLSLNYAKNEEQAKKLTKAAIDLSAATGQSAEDALRQLGGTLEGSAGKLAKLGGGFGQLTEAQLKAGAAIDLVSQRFKGLASAELTTFGGILGQITKAWNDWSEATGLAIIQSPKLKAFLNGILGAIKQLSSAFDPKTIQQFTSDFISSLTSISVFIARNVLPVIEVLSNVILALFNLGALVFGKIVDFISGLTQKVANLLGPFVTGLKNELMATLKDTGEAVAPMIPKAITDGFSGLGETPFSDGVLKMAENIDMAVDQAAPLLQSSGKKISDNLSAGATQGVQESAFGIVGLFDQIFGMVGEKAIQTTVTIQDLAKQIQGSFMGGIVSSFSALGAALAKGENGLAAFGRAVLSALGGVAIQIGTILVSAGLGWSLIPGFQASAGAVPLGLGLIALGGALQALGGGGGKGPATSTGGGVGASGASAESISAEEATAGIQEPGTQLVVNVQGSVFDSDETGLRIADIIKTNFDRRDVQFT